jgi:hypothetical protein
MMFVGKLEGGDEMPKRGKVEVTLYVEQSPGNWAPEDSDTSEYPDEEDARKAFDKKKT